MQHVQRCGDDVGGEQADRKAKLAVGKVIAVGGGAVVVVGWLARCSDVLVRRLARCSDAVLVIAAFMEWFSRRGGVAIVARGVPAQRMHAPVEGSHQHERQQRDEREDGAGAQHRVTQCRHDGARCKNPSAAWH